MSADSQGSTIFDGLSQRVQEATQQACAGNWTRLGHPFEWDSLDRLHTAQRSDANPSVASDVVRLVYLNALATTVRTSPQQDSSREAWPAITLIEKMLDAHYVNDDKIALLCKLAQLLAILGHTGKAVNAATQMLALAKASCRCYFIACAALVKAEVGVADKQQLAALKEALEQLSTIQTARGLSQDELLLLLCTHNRLLEHYVGQGKNFRARRHQRQVSSLLTMFDRCGQGEFVRATVMQRFSPVLLPYTLLPPYSPTR